MTQKIHDLLHKLAKLNKAHSSNAKKLSKVITQLILEVEAIGQTETKGGSNDSMDSGTLGSTFSDNTGGSESFGESGNSIT